MSLNLCDFCGHPHRGAILCPVSGCDCNLEPLIMMEDKMFKKIWKKIKEFFKRLMFWNR